MIHPQGMEIPKEDHYVAWLALLDLKPSLELLDRIALFLTNYLRDNGLACYVLGVSGGIDSAFLAALMHARSIPFVPFSLAIEGNTPHEISRAHDLCRAYGPKDISLSHLQDLTSLYAAISSRFQDVFSNTTRLAEGNLKARLRMMFLYHAAHLFKGCVLATDQIDELLTGFWTLHGDVGDVAPLQLIPKTIEYQLAEMLCTQLDDPIPLKAAMAATPTDGLGISPSDLEQLDAASYGEVEAMLREYFSLQHGRANGTLLPHDKERLAVLQTHTVIQRLESTSYKRQGPVVLNPFG